MSAVEPASVRACPKCEAVNAERAVIQGEYRCTSCGLELAHLDIAANGAVRGVFGWLRAPGDTIQDRYRVRSVLGKGGFGATYLVDDLRLNGKRRALKEVPELLFDEYETALLSRLQHPSIPDIIDRLTAGGMVYLTLEFGGSRTLASERNRHGGRIPFATLLPWMRQLCTVLSYLHTQDPPIIHRDLKPENILLDEGGRIMLIDFGIAKEAMPSAMTRTLGRAATHGFSPPEQAMGTGTDQRSDVYALGATCYALLTGESPPAAHERVAGKELRPPGELSPEIPEGFGAALLQALSLNVNHRQQSVAEFSRMIEEGPDATSAAPRTPSASARTTMVGKIPSRPTAKPKSIRIPTAGTASPHSPPTAVPSPGAMPNRMGMAVGIGAAAVIAIAGGGYYFWSEPKRTETPPPAQTAIAAPAPAPSSPATIPSVPVPAPAPPNSAAEAVQALSAAPPLAGQAPVGGESAQSILNNYTGGSPETSPPAAVTPDPPVSAAVQPPVRPSPPPVPTPGAAGPSAGGILDDNRGGVTQPSSKAPGRIAGAGTGTRSKTPKPRPSRPATAPKPRSSQPTAAPKPAPVWKFDE